MYLGFKDGYITDDATRKAQFTGRINLALDRALHLILKADGRWQFDDSNHTTYPILTGNLVAGQRDYSFTADSDSNLILEIDRVFARVSTSDPYYELQPVDAQSDPEAKIYGYTDGQNTQGSPYTYDKTSTGIFLDPIPDANVTNGLKLYVSREGSYFSTSDTTKTPGFSGLYHDFIPLFASYDYAKANRLDVQETLKRDLLEMEKALSEAYARRDQHQRPVMSPKKIKFI